MIVREPGVGTIRVLLVDNNPAYLAAIARLLTLDPRVVIVGQALSTADPLRQVETNRPDLVVVDIAIGNDNGLEVTRRLKATRHPPKVVVTTLYDAPGYRAAAAAAAADAFISAPNLG